MASIRLLGHLARLPVTQRTLPVFARRGLRTSALRQKNEIHEIPDYGFAPKYKGQIERLGGIRKYPNTILLIWFCVGVMWWWRLRWEINEIKTEQGYIMANAFEALEKEQGRGLPEPDYRGRV